MYYERVVRLDNYNSAKLSRSDVSIFEATNDEAAIKHSDIEKIAKDHPEASEVFVRLDRIQNFPFINNQGVVIIPKSTTNIFRKAWPEVPQHDEG